MNLHSSNQNKLVKYNLNGTVREYAIPTICPYCNHANAPIIATASQTAGPIDECEYVQILVLQTTCCSRHYFAIYLAHPNSSGPKTKFLLTYPKIYKPQIPDSIKNLSPNFALLYDQSFEAEQNNALALAACGYRNALQVLVVDYAKNIKGLEESDLRTQGSDSTPGNYKKLFLLINEYVDSSELKAGAHIIREFGNSATHDPFDFNQVDFDNLKKYLAAFLSFLGSQLTLRELLPPETQSD